jgi:ABC-2 type transport system ATP-binding protein
MTFTLPESIEVGDLPLPAKAIDGRVRVETRQPLADVKTLADWALARGVDLPDLDVRRPSLEDVYLQLTASAS